MRVTLNGFIIIILGLLNGCSEPTLPNIEKPEVLEISQASVSRPQYQPGEYIFCESAGGPWGCEESTVKTSIDEFNTSSHAIPSDFDVTEEIVPSAPLQPTIIYFGLNQSTLSRAAKIKLLDILPNLQNRSVSVHGYTDGLGDQAYNDRLSRKRAEAVKTFLDQAGVKEIQIQSAGLCCYIDEPNSGKNRRVEIFVK